MNTYVVRAFGKTTAPAHAPREPAPPPLSRRSLFQRKAIEKTCNRLNLPSPRRDFSKQLSVKIVRRGPAAQGTAGDISANGGGKTMSNQQTQTSGKANRNTVAAVVIPCLLIGRFLWNVLTPAHEYPMRSVQVMTMTFEAAMLVVLFGLRASMPRPLFWIAVVAGIGLFALRLTGDDGWWTGHLVYFLPPR